MALNVFTLIFDDCSVQRSGKLSVSALEQLLAEL